MTTSVVGSFPLANTQANMERAFSDQVELGVDFPCYPQLVDMTDQFFGPLADANPGRIEKRGSEWFLVEPFDVPAEPIATEYGKFVLDYLRAHPEARERVKGVKACLTGPFTLASALRLDDALAEELGVTPFIFKEPRAVMAQELLEKFARVMRDVAEAYTRMGFDVISLDEPTLSLLAGRRAVYKYKPDYVVEVLDSALEGVGTTSSIHVCGQVPPILRDVLLATRVDVVDHEFATEEHNFQVYSREALEASGKQLALGCVNTKVAKVPGMDDWREYVEGVDAALALVKRGLERFGGENLVLKPDCGMGGLLGTFGEEIGYAVATGKLKALVEAAARAKKEAGLGGA